MNFNVQPATHTDATELTAILNDALQQKIKHGDMVWGTTPYQIDDAEHRIEGGNTYIAYLDNEAVGTAILLWEDPGMWGEQPPIAGYIHGLAVKDGFYGQKIGARILDWAADKVSHQGRQLLRLDCPATNEGLCTYYEKLGFRKVAVKPNPMHAGETTAYFERTV